MSAAETIDPALDPFAIVVGEHRKKKLVAAVELGRKGGQKNTAAQLNARLGNLKKRLLRPKREESISWE